MDANVSCNVTSVANGYPALSGMIDMHVTRVKTISAISGKTVLFSVDDAVSIRHAVMNEV